MDTVLESDGSKKGKCHITWKFKESEAHVSFPVRGCRLCLRTSDSNFDKKFAEYLKAEEVGSRCICTLLSSSKTEPIKTVLSFMGKCQGPEECWRVYKIRATDTWERHGNFNATMLTHHEDSYHETKFDYEHPPCNATGCEDGGCESVEIPALSDCMTTSEKQIVGEDMAKLERGEIQEKDIDRDALAVIKGLTESDKAEIFYAGLVPADGGPVTVGHLKAFYQEKFAGSGMNVEKLMVVAGLDPVKGLHEVLTKDMLVRFLNPSC